MICAFECTTLDTDSQGQLGFFSTNKTINIFQTSIIKSSINSNLRSPIHNLYGYHNLNSCNFSNNNGYAWSGPTHFNGIEIYSNFINIEQSNSNLIILYFSGGLINYNYLNFFKNSCNSHGLIYSNSNAKCLIKNSIFFQNTFTLFTAIIGSNINISNSFISHSGTTKSGSIYYSNSNNFFIITKPLKFTLYSTYYCSVNIPLIFNITIKKKNFLIFKI